MSVSVAEYLLQFGVAGLVVVLLITGLLVPGFIYRDLQRANEKLADALSVERQRNADLQQLAATGVHALDAMREVAEENRRVREREMLGHVAHAPVQSAGGEVS